MREYQKRLAEYNFRQSWKRYYEAEAKCTGCQQIRAFERFLFIDLPLFFAGGGVGSATFKGMAEGYASGAFERFIADGSTQAIFKGGIDQIDFRQLTINTFVGIGGNNYQQIAKVATANLGLNTFNNVVRSFENDPIQGIYNDMRPNAAKIVTGFLGGMTGVAGSNIMTSTVLPSIYGNGTDAFWNYYYKTK